MPRQVQGFRTVKPHSEKQQIHSQLWGKTRPDSVTAIIPRDAGISKSSWWMMPRTRKEFDAALARELPRIRESKFARINVLRLDE